jgi:hypothetical protein
MLCSLLLLRPCSQRVKLNLKAAHSTAQHHKRQFEGKRKRCTVVEQTIVE